MKFAQGTMAREGPPGALGPERAWAALLDLARRGRTSWQAFAAERLVLGADGRLRPAAVAQPEQVILTRSEDGWLPGEGLPAEARTLFDLYLPVCGSVRERPLVVGHLGQSLDGHIATRGGDSCFVTGGENIRHLHRMRALCDAIVVGAGTVAADDPRLTTRLVPGPSPVRVILDPRGRLDVGRRVFQDGAAPTLLICEADGAGASKRARGQAEVVGVPANGDGLRLDALLNALWDRGLRTLFVEGGGVTVSRFLRAGRLDRLQIAVAPLLIGAGRPGLSLPPTERLRDCLRLRPRVFRMGEDVLFDCDLRAEATLGQTQAPSALEQVP